MLRVLNFGFRVPHISFVLIFYIVFAFYPPRTSAQSRLVIPSDTLNKKRVFTVAGTWTILYGTALVGLSQVWYKNYEKSNFHFFDDHREWLQMDKAGHAFTNYFEAKWTSDALQWAGVKQKKAVVYGVITSLVFQTTLEMFDGFSAKWGFSPSDMAANVSGGALFLAQELTWREQRISIKYSFHPINYNNNPYYPGMDNQVRDHLDDLYGTNTIQQSLKDYNGQTYWLSFNIKSLGGLQKFPAWLNIDFGYGGEGMLSGYNNSWTVNDQVLNRADIPRVRQFYLSPDIDFTRIKTKSHLLKTVFDLINVIKCPAPALMLDSRGRWKGYWLYF